MSEFACLFFHPFERLPNCDRTMAVRIFHGFQFWRARIDQPDMMNDTKDMKRCHRDGIAHPSRAGKKFSARGSRIFRDFLVRTCVLVQLRSSTMRTRSLESSRVDITLRKVNIVTNNAPTTPSFFCTHDQLLRQQRAL